MRGIFSPDSKFMIAMGRVGDLIILNLLFVICCIPVFTIGAAKAALYTVCFKIAEDRDQGVVMDYIRAFKESFKESTLLWIMLLPALIFVGGDICIFYSLTSPLRYLFVLFSASMVLLLLIISYSFPLISRFENTITCTVKNALALSIGYLPISLVIMALNYFPFLLAVLAPALFMYLGIVWAVFYFAAAAYLNCLLFKKIFAPYINDRNSV